MLEPLQDGDWRAFRLLLMTLSDPELQVLNQQLQREMVHRQECDRSVTQLFFTSLSSLDLQRVDAEIRYEVEGRLEILRKLEEQSRSRPPTPRQVNKPRRKAKAQRA